MKKSTIYLIISLFVAFNFVYSQKPNTKKISIPYLQSPLNPLNKNFDYSDLSRSFENIKRISEIIKSAFSGLNPPRYGNYSNEMTNELSNKINDCINIWENAIKEYVPKKKRTKISDKIIDHLYINLATAYFLNGELNKASENLKKVKMNKGEIKEAKYFSSRLEDISNRLKLQ